MPYKSITTIFLISLLFGCGSRQESGNDGNSTTIRVEGSDTMVNLAQAWSEKYQAENTNITIEVSGGGSGVGIASLIQGLADMANASRQMTPRETARATKEFSLDPQEFIVGQDALAVFIHKDNPLEEISIEQLAQLYGDGGSIQNWSDLGVTMPDNANDEVVRVSRQNNSGTYAYFREFVLNDNDFKLGSIDLSGSADVISMVEKTISAIGYSGMGYATPNVKMVKIKIDNDSEAIAPTVENALNGNYPITRPLRIYTPQAPSGIVREYLDWIMGESGQAIITEMGYVPYK